MNLFFLFLFSEEARDTDTEKHDKEKGKIVRAKPVWFSYICKAGPGTEELSLDAGADAAKVRLVFFVCVKKSQCLSLSRAAKAPAKMLFASECILCNSSPLV